MGGSQALTPQRLVEMVGSTVAPPDRITYCTLAAKCVRFGMKWKVEELFEEMAAERIPFNAVALTTWMRCGRHVCVHACGCTYVLTCTRRHVLAGTCRCGSVCLGIACAQGYTCMRAHVHAGILTCMHAL